MCMFYFTLNPDIDVLKLASVIAPNDLLIIECLSMTLPLATE
jgi:hypothetical protein